MKKLLISLLTIIAAFGFLNSFAYNLSNTDLRIVDKIFNQIVAISEQKNNQPLFISNIKLLIINLQEDPKTNNRTKAIFWEIIDSIEDVFECEWCGWYGMDEQWLEFTAIQEEMLSVVNTERNKLWKANLKLNKLLNIAAQKHAEYMNQTDDFAHTTQAGLAFDQRIINEHYSFLKAWENIAYGQTSITQVMQDRMQSPGHRANILDGEFKEFGVGYSGKYWVQLFAQKN